MLVSGGRDIFHPDCVEPPPPPPLQPANHKKIINRVINGAKYVLRMAFPHIKTVIVTMFGWKNDPKSRGGNWLLRQS
jgi:hypothetical protein